jgi:hypothetical protein
MEPKQRIGGGDWSPIDKEVSDQRIAKTIYLGNKERIRDKKEILIKRMKPEEQK